MYFDKGLDLTSPRQFLLAHTSGHLSWVAFNASNDGVGVRPVFGPFIQLFYHDHLFACLTALENDCDLYQIHVNFRPHPISMNVPCRA
jgi:hypothetical protein